MNIQELTTWKRLLDLDLDGSDTALPFGKRLARENGWSTGFAAQAIEEYRKFCFLAAHAGHPVTPSEEVDQVWHLHMLYSQHYWDTLCRDTLEMSLHHGPTQGGAAEDRKYHAWYENTLASYRRYFGEPPESLWPGSHERFDARNDFVRVNRRDVVTFDRAVLRRGALAVLLGGGVLAMAHALAQSDAAAAAPPGMPRMMAVGLFLVIVILIALGAAASGNRRASRRHRRRDASAAAVGAGDGGGAAGKTCPDGSAAHGGNCGDASAANGCGSSGCGGGGCGGGGCGGGS